MPFNFSGRSWTHWCRCSDEIAARIQVRILLEYLGYPQLVLTHWGRNVRLFADDIFKRIFLNENIKISIKISLQFVPMGPINIILALVQIMAWRRSGGKPLSEPMIVSLLTHICVTRPRWVNGNFVHSCWGALLKTRHIHVCTFLHDQDN